MSADFVFTPVLSANTALVGRAMRSLPGTCVDWHSHIFPTWTEAECHARSLNEDLGWTPFEVRAMSIDTLLTTRRLDKGCSALLEASRQLRLKNESILLGVALAQIDLGATFCRMACAPRPEAVKCRLLRKADTIFSRARSCTERCHFSPEAVLKILAATNRLRKALDQFEFA